MDNGDFLEQREQSQACLVYAESQQNWAKPIETFWSSESRVKLAWSMPSHNRIGRSQLLI